jgi:hypothetical protein
VSGFEILRSRQTEWYLVKSASHDAQSSPVRPLLALVSGGRPRSKARDARSPQIFGSVGMRSERRSGQKLWQKLRAPLQILGALAVLLVINLYVLYYRHGTSLPALLKQAETGRALSARLSGPVGTPPQPNRPVRKPKLLPPLSDYPRIVEQPLHASDSLSDVLTKVAVPARQKNELETALQGVLDPGGLGPGQSLTFYYDHEDRLQSVDYRLTDSLAYHLERVQTGSADRFVPVKQTQPLAVTTQRIEINSMGKMTCWRQFSGPRKRPRWRRGSMRSLPAN